MNPASTPVGSVEEINPIGQQLEETKYLTTSYGGPIPIPKLPCADLLGNSDHYSQICVPLYYASSRGDWEAAEVILDKHQDLDLVQYGINENYDTALHVAASSENSKLMEKYVQNLVNKMTREQLELQNKNHNTALCLAAASGNVKTVMTILEKNPTLVDIPGNKGMMPLYMASLLGQGDMVNYIYDYSNKMSGDFWTQENRSWVLQKCVEADLFDIALKIVTDRPELAVNGSVLGVLAGKSEAFRRTKPYTNIWRFIREIILLKSGPAKKTNDAMPLLKIIWTNIMKLPKATIEDIIRGPANIITGPADEIVTEMGVLFLATEMGNTEFVVELICQYPDLMWRRNDNNQTIFHVAVSRRHEGIYNLVHEIGLMKDMITPLKDKEGNNMLHLVGKCSKKERLQMRHELLWFKEVKNLMPLCYQEQKNKDGLTPHELFMEEHKDLISQNQKWMKDTANQCLVVAALIASIGFAAAFTVPGGNNQDNGMPIFLDNQCFIIFAMSDAVSLVLSTISIITFLSMFISPYSQQELLEPIPPKMILGLATLFGSISAVLFSFSASFCILYHDKFIWIPYIIQTLISIPCALYLKQQYDFLMDIILSMYGSNHLFRPKKRSLNYQNPRF